MKIILSVVAGILLIVGTFAWFNSKVQAPAPVQKIVNTAEKILKPEAVVLADFIYPEIAENLTDKAYLYQEVEFKFPENNGFKQLFNKVLNSKSLAKPGSQEAKEKLDTVSKIKSFALACYLNGESLPVCVFRARADQWVLDEIAREITALKEATDADGSKKLEGFTVENDRQKSELSLYVNAKNLDAFKSDKKLFERSDVKALLAGRPANSIGVGYVDRLTNETVGKVFGAVKPAQTTIDAGQLDQAVKSLSDVSLEQMAWWFVADEGIDTTICSKDLKDFTGNLNRDLKLVNLVGPATAVLFTSGLTKVVKLLDAVPAGQAAKYPVLKMLDSVELVADIKNIMAPEITTILKVNTSVSEAVNALKAEAVKFTQGMQVPPPQDIEGGFAMPVLFYLISVVKLSDNEVLVTNQPLASTLQKVREPASGSLVPTGYKLQYYFNLDVIGKAFEPMLLARMQGEALESMKELRELFKFKMYASSKVAASSDNACISLRADLKYTQHQ